MNATKKTVLIYGRTGSGKTAQIGELAEYVFKTLGLKTRLATADKGGTVTIQPYIDLGIIEVEEIGEGDPWIFWHNVTKGNRKGADGKWYKPDNDHIGLWAFESMRAFAESLMADMAKKAGQNVSIGGGANISFSVTGDGETLKVAGSNMAHFGVAQGRVTENVWDSFKLDGPFIVWTTSVSKDEDTTASGKILGPDVIGKALTAEVPRWFNLTLRQDVVPAQQGKPARHLLYLGTHVDQNAGNATAVGNIRRPIDASPLQTLVVEPASIVKALSLLEKGSEEAKEAIRKRLSLPAPQSNTK